MTDQVYWVYWRVNSLADSAAYGGTLCLSTSVELPVHPPRCPAAVAIIQAGSYDVNSNPIGSFRGLSMQATLDQTDF